MSIVDRVHIPQLRVTSVNSRVARAPKPIDCMNSGIVRIIEQVNLAELYGFPSRMCISPLFRGTDIVQTYARLDPRDFILPEIHYRPQSLAGYSTLLAVLNDSRPAFGKHSPRIEEEAARWLALLHEIGIIVTLFRAMKACLFKDMKLELAKPYLDVMNGRKEFLAEPTAIIGYTHQYTTTTWAFFVSTWDGIRTRGIRSIYPTDEPVVCAAPAIRT
ncbi:hypothetical protein FRC11_010043, partial [Ceratobasidium sp. 423]